MKKKNKNIQNKKKIEKKRKKDKLKIKIIKKLKVKNEKKMHDTTGNRTRDAGFKSVDTTKYAVNGYYERYQRYNVIEHRKIFVTSHEGVYGNRYTAS